MNMNPNTRNMVPPDGGWGLLVIFGSVLIDFSMRSIGGSFGLLFGDLLDELKVKTTGAALITGTFEAVLNFSGLAVAPMIRTFSYRKVAVLGGIMHSAGLALTYFATSKTHIIVTYGVIRGLGSSLADAAAFITLNQYFLKRRSLAFGITMIGSTIGMACVPHAVRFLLEHYGFRGAILILGAATLHAVVGSSFFQPAAWHLIQETQHIQKSDNIIAETEQTETLLNMKKIAINNEDFKDQIFSNQRASWLRSLSLASLPTSIRKMSSSIYISDIISVGVVESKLHTEVSFRAPKETRPVLRRDINYSSAPMLDSDKSIIQPYTSYQKFLDKQLEKTPHVAFVTNKLQLNDTILNKMVRFLDLDLLKDPVYINLIIGIALFCASQQSFTMVLPFFLQYAKFDKKDVAFFLSIQAVCDGIGRVAFPVVCERIPIPKRAIFIISLILLAATRTALVETTNSTLFLICVGLSGSFKGCCIVFYLLILSEYGTPDNIAAVYGLNMVFTGITILTMGLLLGHIRDISGSYRLYLHLLSSLLLICVILWTIEFTILWFNARQKHSKKTVNSVQ